MHEPLSLSEASRLSGINRRTLQRWIRDGLVTTNERGHITLESVESAAARPKKAGRPAGQNLPGEAEWMRLLNRENRPDVLAKIVEKITRKHHEELVKCLPPEQRTEALKAILAYPFSETERARAEVENSFLIPEQRRKEWQQMQPELTKKYPGAVIVPWEERTEFIEFGAVPAKGLHRTTARIEKERLLQPSKPLTWGELARPMGARVYIVPAMETPDKHLALVEEKVVRTGDSISPAPKLKLRRRE